jgi:AcrR family transcriptional regulator
MANVRTPRRAWVDAALAALAAGGPDAVRVEALAVSLGVSKGGFYWHFTGRQALLDEMLDAWEKAATDDLVAVVNDEAGDARATLQRLFELTSSPQGLAVEWAVRDWARRDPDVAVRLQRVDDRRMRHVRSLFAQLWGDQDQVEARSILAYSLFIASDFIAAQRGDQTGHILQLAVNHLLDGD